MAADSRAVDRAWMVAAIVVVGVALVRLFLPVADPLDFALRVVSSARVGRGEIPYRDVSVLYGPLAYVVQGAVQRLSPFSATTTARLWYCVLALVIAELLRRLHSTARRTISGAMAFAATAALAAWFAYYSGAALLLVLVAVLLAGRALAEAPARAAAFGVGAVGVLAVFDRPNFGGYVLAAAGAGLVALVVRRRRVGVERALWFAAGVALTSACVVVAMMRVGAWQPYVGDLSAYLAHFGARTRPLRLLAPSSMAAFATTALAVGWMAYATLRASGSTPFTVFAVVLCLAFFSYSLSRFDPQHAVVALALVSALVPAHEWPRPSRATATLGVWLFASVIDSRAAELIVLALLVFVLIARVRRSSGWVTGARDVALAAALLLLSPLPTLARAELTAIRSGAREVRGGFLVDAGEAKLLDLVGADARRGDGLFIASYPGTCECTTDVCADVRDYLITGALPRGRLWFFDTPSSPFPDVQDAMSAALDVNRTRYVVVHKPPKTVCPVPVSVHESHRFYDHVRAGYDERARIDSVEGELIVYERRDAEHH